MDQKRVNTSFKIYSFDVFDTCISRLYERPSDLFFEVGRLVAPDRFSEDQKSTFSRDFAANRMLAERRANRSHGKKRSCRFSEIYDLIDLPADCLIAKPDIARIELELEESSSFAIASTQKLISSYRAVGGKIVFISDMYLDKQFVTRLLRKHEMAEPGDAVYVSSENTLTKRSGDLFKHVLAQENITACEMLHHGDDLVADIRMPRRLGIQSFHVQGAQIFGDEKIAGDCPGNVRASQLNALSKYVRLSHFGGVDGSQLQLLNLIAPFLLQFTFWVMLEARRRGVKTLFFLAKDSDITFKIAQVIGSEFPEISLKYLYSSRRAWLKPSIDFDNQDWKALALPDGPRSSLKDALERIDISKEAMRVIADYCERNRLEFSTAVPNEECSALLDEVLGAEVCKEAFLAEIEASKAVCLEYLAQEGLLAGEPWAIVDTGWQLNCQAALRRMLAADARNCEVLGFYLGLSGSHLSERVAGEALAFTKTSSIFSRRRVAVEHFLFASMHSSTVGYMKGEGVVRPIFSKDVRTQSHEQYTDSLHDYALKFAESFVRLGLSRDEFVRSRPRVVEKVTELLLRPKRGLLPWIAGIRISSDSRHSIETQQHMFAPLRLSDLIRIGNSYRKGRQSELNFYWLEASVASSNALIRSIFRFVWLFRKGPEKNHEQVRGSGIGANG